MASASDRRPPVPDDRGSLQPDFRLLAVATVCLLAVLALSAVGPAVSGGPGGAGLPGGGGGNPVLDALGDLLPMEFLGDVGSRIGVPLRDLLFDLLGGFADAIDPETIADVVRGVADLLQYLDPETVRDIGSVLADVLPLLDGGMGSPGGDGGGDSSNQLLETVLGALAVALVVGLIAAILWRWGGLLLGALRRTGGRSASFLRALPALLVDLAVRAGRALEAAAGRLTSAVRQLVLDPAETIRSALVGLPGAVRALPGRIAAAILALFVAVLPDRLVAWLRTVLGEEPAESADAASGVGASDRAGDADGRPLLDIQALWRAFVAAVRPPNLSTKTPGEVGRYAVDRGFPSAPTRTIVDTYRAVEYGDRQPSDGRLERVLAAVREIAGDDAPDGDVGEAVDPGGTPAGDDRDDADPSDGAADGTGEAAAESEDGEEIEEAEKWEPERGGDGP